MPEINLISITPSQLNGTGESGQYDTSPFGTFAGGSGSTVSVATTLVTGRPFVL